MTEEDNPSMPSGSPSGDGADSARLPERIGDYLILGQLGSGGMGAVYAARHPDSTEVVALKLIRPGRAGAELTRRFQRESDLLRRLRHPGIAAFYDAGEAELRTGETTISTPFLAMELVQGDPLRVRTSRPELEDRQRVELLARVCDAVAHAHAEGIVHRDLKPANVLVADLPDDPIGQPKILDFGVARVTEHEDYSLTQTAANAVLGTVEYMSPEQVSAGAKPVDVRSDVYSLGVLIFEMLTAEMPYSVRGRSVASAARVIQFVEPTPLGTARPSLAGDLELVLARALEKEPERRYASAAELALDLRAWLAGRPVRARPPSALRRARRWVERHRVASTLLLTGAVALIGVSALYAEAQAARDVAVAKSDLAKDSARRAQEREAEVQAQRERLLRLSDWKSLTDLEHQAAQLWPIGPRLVEDLEAWLAQAEPLGERLPQHHQALEDLRQGRVEAEASELAWWEATVGQLVEGLERFVAPDAGLLDDVRGRLDRSSSLWERSVGDHRDAWRRARAAVAEDPRFHGLELDPQPGLVPLGTDPGSGLQEFWLLESGTLPERDESGRFEIGEATGLVFVLLPGGTFFRGADTTTDPQAEEDEGPRRSVNLTPFFLSKYELTQGQWSRLAGDNPSVHTPGQDWGEHFVDLRHPVENVSWDEAREVLWRLGLVLPTEARWEYATRAGTTSPWSTGTRKESLPEFANLADQYCRRTLGPVDWRYEDWDDNHHCHAPVGSFRPNPFGLHDVHGNVAEWCLDRYAPNAYQILEPDDPVVPMGTPGDRRQNFHVVRGGDFSNDASHTRSAYRHFTLRDSSNNVTGVRPARELAHGTTEESR